MNRCVAPCLLSMALMAQCLWGTQLLAMPAVPDKTAKDKFTASDVDGNGLLSPEEFKTAFPGMRDEAFTVIDKNKDKAIDRTEWNAFAQNHSAKIMGRGSMNSMPSSNGTPTSPNNSVPLVTPPDGK